MERRDLKKSVYLIFSLIFILLLSACESNNQSKKKMIPFSFKDQNGQPFGTNELAGKIWIADFIFTKCETVCPPMTMEMAALQKKFKEEDIEVDFVSFTVDPTVDSPEVLIEYLEQFTDDQTNWHVLTGYTQHDIESFAREQFQTIVQKPHTSTQVIHGTNFYLVNKQGELVNEYNYVEASYIDEMMKEIKKIQRD
jgi:protein SCO1